MIEHLKSGLSISTHIGCPMKCDYCVLSSMKEFKRGPIAQQSPESIMLELKSENALFFDGKTALFINNRTDPFLPSVMGSTIALLTLLASEHISSPVIIISKFPLPEIIRPFFDSLHLMYIYSYSGYTHDFNYSHLKHDLKVIKDNTPFGSRFHYFRPIIPNVNDDPVVIHTILETFEDAGFKGSIIAGIRINRDNIGLLDVGTKFDPQHKLLSNNIFLELCKWQNAKGNHYLIFRHTSCAISSFMQEPCNLLYFARAGHCSEFCENYHICKNIPSVDFSYIEYFLNSHLPLVTDWSFSNGTLTISNDVTQEHVAFIRNVLGINVIAENVRLSASEQIITSFNSN